MRGALGELCLKCQGWAEGPEEPTSMRSCRRLVKGLGPRVWEGSRVEGWYSSKQSQKQIARACGECLHVYIYMQIYTYMHVVCMYIYIYVYVLYIYVFAYAHIHIITSLSCLWFLICIHIYIYTVHAYRFIHIYIHTYVGGSCLSCSL